MRGLLLLAILLVAPPVVAEVPPVAPPPPPLDAVIVPAETPPVAVPPPPLDPSLTGAAEPAAAAFPPDAVPPPPPPLPADLLLISPSTGLTLDAGAVPQHGQFFEGDSVFYGSPEPEATGETAGEGAAGEQGAGGAAPKPGSERRMRSRRAAAATLGVERLTARTTRIIVSGGYNRIGKSHYALVYPQLGLRFGNFALGLGVPLNLELFDAAYPKDPPAGENHIVGFANFGKVRAADWDEGSEWARVLTYLGYGQKGDPFYADIGQRHVSTLGNGTIMRRYAPNIDVDRTHVGAQLDASNDRLGVELMTNDVTTWDLIGGRGALRPLALAGAESKFAKSITVGLSGAVDRDAPDRLQLMPEPACPVKGQCAPANVPAVDDDNRLVASPRSVPMWGFDLEAKVMETETVDLKPYLDYSAFALTGEPGEQAGGGFTLGMSARFSAGERRQHVFRLVGELRALGEGYQPHYFDTFYEIDTLLDGGDGGVRSGRGEIPRTKLQATIGPKRAPARTGYAVEAAYEYVERVGMMVSLEGEDSSPAKNFIAHLEVPAFSWFQLFASLYKRSFEDMGSVFALDADAVAYAGARLKLMPVLYLSGRAFRSFELDAYKGKDGPLGTLQYRNVAGFSADLDLGVEF